MITEALSQREAIYIATELENSEKNSIQFDS